MVYPRACVCKKTKEKEVEKKNDLLNPRTCRVVTRLAEAGREIEHQASPRMQRSKNPVPWPVRGRNLGENLGWAIKSSVSLRGGGSRARESIAGRCKWNKKVYGCFGCSIFRTHISCHAHSSPLPLSPCVSPVLLRTRGPLFLFSTLASTTLLAEPSTELFHG